VRPRHWVYDGQRPFTKRRRIIATIAGETRSSTGRKSKRDAHDIWNEPVRREALFQQKTGALFAGWLTGWQSDWQALEPPLAQHF